MRQLTLGADCPLCTDRSAFVRKQDCYRIFEDKGLGALSLTSDQPGKLIRTLKLFYPVGEKNVFALLCLTMKLNAFLKDVININD